VNAQLLSFDVCSHDPVDPISICERYGCKAKPLRLFDKLLWMARAFQEGKLLLQQSGT